MPRVYQIGEHHSRCNLTNTGCHIRPRSNGNCYDISVKDAPTTAVTTTVVELCFASFTFTYFILLAETLGYLLPFVFWDLGGAYFNGGQA